VPPNSSIGKSITTTRTTIANVSITDIAMVDSTRT
jgi:hypothetical protein